MMKKVAKIFVCGLAMTAVCMASAEAQDLKDLLNGLGDVVKETVAQNKTVTVAELKGTWKTTGPALVLKSGNIAQQAGGSAMTTAAEAKLKPYYKKVGLLNTSCVFDSEGNFTLTVKKAPIKGKLTANSDGTFKMQLLSTIAGLTNDEHSMTVYVQKVGNEMSISMDVKKLMTIVQAVAKKGDLKTINTVTSMLSNYIIRKTKRFAIPERAVYFLKTKRTAEVLPHPKNFRPAYAGIHTMQERSPDTIRTPFFSFCRFAPALRASRYAASLNALYAATLCALTSLPRKARREPTPALACEAS